MGWVLPTLDALPAAHGPLMVAGFLGVLIPLERAVAIRQKWMFLVPLLAGIGWVTLLFSQTFGMIFLNAGSIGTFLILLVMLIREPRPHTFIMFIGALSFVIGNILWARGTPLFFIVAWWITFLVLTIGGERLELNRVLRIRGWQIALFYFFSILLVAGAAIVSLEPHLSGRLIGGALAGFSVWFILFDIARRNLRHKLPITQYIAFCLFTGYFWLAVAGFLFMKFGQLIAGPVYDAALHAVFVGFVFSMIFGHAPIIFPAVLGVPIRFLRSFYIQLVLLHTSLILRLVGDLSNLTEVRKWGGILNETAILLFVLLTAVSILKKERS